MTNPSDEVQQSEYDPFIHGTTSAALALMSKTNFQLMPVLKMIDDFQVAPMGGELFKGGYEFIGFELVQKEKIGAISFGNLKTGEYNLKEVTGSYTQFVPPTKTAALNHFRHLLNRPIVGAELNLLLVYFTRARQMHESLDQIITKNELDILTQRLKAIAQFYYFVQLLGTYIYPDFEAMKKALLPPASLTKRDITDAVYSFLNFEHLIKRIIESQLDVKSILLNPSEENLGKALALLQLPDKLTIKSGICGDNKEIELPVTQFFSLTKSSTSKKSRSYKKSHFVHLAQNKSGDSINNLLENFLSQELNSDFFINMANDAQKYVSALEDRIRIFNKLANTPQGQFELTVDQRILLDSTYPIIFVSESDLIKPHVNEYRSTGSLKLGDDIRMIATDDKKHREEVRKYLRHHQLNPVQVVLFSDLEKAAHDQLALPLSIDSQPLRAMLAKTRNSKHSALFYELYALLDDLNEKRNKFRYTNPQVFATLDRLLVEITKVMDERFSTDKPLTRKAIQTFSIKSNALIEREKPALELHRGCMGILDTMLTIFASLVVFYPAVYLYQKNKNVTHSFFNTDSGIKAQDTIVTLDKLIDDVDDFPDDKICAEP
ncbi:hypothetical protein Lbir_1799 [Legionella birminghamensis]|uniref:Uncharacterized protein n=1 Tax=Legionella birminghamensis TaxID=28083 RepID=A0A378I6K5_9GAMM|nr:hypothetical protein [Legionella birminghamensis]KTC70216.1 hypothetical protein Lbir_1799 [Legionella birminghamensis]STX30376.1 Uncharacterised protein [Legionella birminghamensis]